MFGRKIYKVFLPYLDFTRRILVGSSVLNVDQHSQSAAVSDWGRTVWKSLLADSDLR